MIDCQSCGACCCAYRVDFDQAELAGGAFAWGKGVPPLMALPLTATLWRLKGTDSPGRCIGLDGEVGRRVACTIYAERPGPCRELEAGSEACHRARRRMGLADDGPLPASLAGQ